MGVEGVRSWVLGSAPGPVLEVLERGATVARFEVGCADGERRDIGLGYATLAEYAERPHYWGAVVGRYANRIRDGRFELDGRIVKLARNDGRNALHGGHDGFDRRTWSLVSATPTELELALVSPDGDQGFPGRLDVSARYRVTGDEVRLLLTARTDAPTVVNLTSHVYLALPDPVLTVPADAYLPVDDEGLPPGDPEPVDGTRLDLRAGVPLAELARAGGLDHTLLVGGAGPRRLAVLQSALVTVEVVSDQPGLQVYTGNSFDGTDRTWSGARVEQHGAVALEPQHLPDSPNHPAYPSTVLRPGEEYRHEIRWRISR